MLNFLHTLDLSNNNLTDLPLFPVSYTLSELYVQGNQLNTLPDWIGENANLHWLDISNNNITHLPAIMPGHLPFSFTSLTTAMVNLSNNMLCAMDPMLEQWADMYSPNWRDTQSCFP